jgi:hypothetical protein
MSFRAIRFSGSFAFAAGTSRRSAARGSSNGRITSRNHFSCRREVPEILTIRAWDCKKRSAFYRVTLAARLQHAATST